MQELKLPQWVMAIFDRQDKEDDFRGVDESSRNEIHGVGEEIHRSLRDQKCLVVFHNGSDTAIDLNDFGIVLSVWFGNKVLWTFRGRLRLNSKITEKVDNSHLCLYDEYSTHGWNFLLENEASEIDGCSDNLGQAVCFLYLLALNSQGGDVMDYNWATHASSYWVCDGIIQGGQDEKAWKVAAALHHQIRMEDYSSNTLLSFGGKLETPPERWMVVRILLPELLTVHPESTSFFLLPDTSGSDPSLRLLPYDMFHQSDNLHVLKLCRCTFSFSSPPFHCCRNIRFLGLDGCKDRQEEDGEKQDRPAMVFFQSLWVLDIRKTDWELVSSPEITDQMSANIREVHINKGRIWRRSMEWRQLQNVRKLRVIEPTSPWVTEEMDEFRDMVKLELLDLSGNSAMQVLPSLSGATSLKTLVLDGCVGLKHVGPEELPPSLESFSLDARAGVDHNKKAEITSISLAGCARLASFTLCGSLPNLEKLDLSGTLVKTLDLKDEVLQVPILEEIILLGCLQLYAILWPEMGLPKLTLLHIDSSVCRVHTKLDQAYVSIMDIRFFQSLVLQSNVAFCWKSARSHLNLCVPCTSKSEEKSYKRGQIMGRPGPKLLIPKNYRTYMDVDVDDMAIDHDHINALQFQPSDFHVEIGEGISDIGMESSQGIKAIVFAVAKTESLHVHDNSSVTTVIPEHMMSIEDKRILWRHLKRCHVVRCPRMHTVFTIWFNYYCFEKLENFWAADLRMAHCIWSKGRTTGKDDVSFAKLRNIHLYSCPRLAYVLPLLGFTLRSLETLHIVNCGDLIEVFPVEEQFLTRIATDHRNGVLEFPKLKHIFPKLKHIYLHGVYKLQRICEAKMFAPNLETVRLRGCWGLRRLPAVGPDSRPVVECEKDWWEKLEWDGLEAGHHPSLFEPRHSSYYKKPLPRGSVLR